VQNFLRRDNPPAQSRGDFPIFLPMSISRRYHTERGHRGPRFVAAWWFGLLLAVAAAFPCRGQEAAQESIAIARRAADSTVWLLPRDAIVRAVEATAGNGVHVAELRIDDGRVAYLLCTGTAGGRPAALAFELQRDAGAFVLPSASEYFQCLGDNCPACAFRKNRAGQITECRCASRESAGACAFRRSVERAQALLAALLKARAVAPR
jgi:hypothetical protein